MISDISKYFQRLNKKNSSSKLWQKFSQPILIISNLNNDDIITKSMDLGSNGYVIKSELNPAQFITEVKKYLNIL